MHRRSRKSATAVSDLYRDGPLSLEQSEKRIRDIGHHMSQPAKSPNAYLGLVKTFAMSFRGWTKVD